MYRLILFLLVIPAISAAAKPNLLLITIDTLRADRLGCYGRKEAHTPNLDALAQKSLLFENAISEAPLTLPSHTSLLTGRYPFHHGVRDNAGRLSESESTLAEILKANGYHTYAAIGGFPLDHRFGLNQGFDFYNDELPHERHRPLDFGSERSADAVLAAVKGFQIASPYFLWVHFYDPHAPYHHGGYEGEIAFTDSQVGKLLAMLPLQNTIIAVAGDHGESLGEHKEWTHRIFIYDSTLRVPFFIAVPGAKPERIPQQARLIDFAPTILALMQISTAAPMDGVVLPAKTAHPAIVESMFPKLQLGWSALIGVRTDEWKFIEAPKPELYDLKNDPLEANNVYPLHADVVRKFRALLPAGSTKPASGPVDAETAERLASLGYIGSGASAGNTDPKDMISVWNEIEKAVDLKSTESQSGVTALEKARQVDPGNPMILNILAEKYAESGKWKPAETILSSLLKADPANPLALSRLARLQLRTNRPADAKTTAEKLLAINRESAEAHLVAAQACLVMNETRCAQQHLESVLKVDPLDHESRVDLGNLYLQAQKNAEAEKEFRIVLQKEPSNVQALNGTATVAYQRKQYRESETQLQKALKVKPADPQTKMNLALVYSQTGRSTEAASLYKEILASDQTPAAWKAEAAQRLKELQP